MPPQRSICLVTDEIAPLTTGESGRALRALVLDSLERSPSLQFHFLLAPDARIDAERLRTSFEGRVQVHLASATPAREASSRYPPATAFVSSWHAESLELLLALKHLERNGHLFDVIEFPDRKGWAFCTLQEKRLGLGFAGSEVAVRLHGTMGLLRRRLGQPLTRESLFGFELERKSLLDAERVTSGDRELAALSASYYGFSGEWLARVSAETLYPVAQAETQLDPPCGGTGPLVSVVMTNFNLARHLPAALASVAASGYPDLEIVLVDDASTGAEDARLLEQLESGQDPATASIRIVRNPSNRGLAASRNLGIRAARGKYLLPLDADDCISPRFIELAVRALEAQPGFDGVVPTAARFHSEEELDAGQFSTFLTFLGDAPTLGLVENCLSTATALLRRSLFDRHGYDEDLSSYEDWSLYLRLAHAGCRFLVTNEAHFHYRKRPGSMIDGLTRVRHLQLLARIHESLLRPLPSSAHSFALLMPAMAATLEIAELRGEPAALLLPSSRLQPMRYWLVDAINGALKKVPLAHRALKALGKRFPAQRRKA